MTIIERFWKKTRRGRNGCIIWTGARAQGYGVFAPKGKKTVRAHRWLLEQVVGPLPRRFDAMHSCDNRPCVALQHLSPGTRKANMVDAAGKGRMPRGVQIPSSKLTAKQIKAIRDARARGATFTELAAAWRISIGHVHRIVTGKSWRHAKGPTKAGKKQAPTLRDRVHEIRALARAGETQGAIAKKLGIGQASVSRILTGKRWADV
jgi:hypothetical protein